MIYWCSCNGRGSAPNHQLQWANWMQSCKNWSISRQKGSGKEERCHRSKFTKINWNYLTNWISTKEKTSSIAQTLLKTPPNIAITSISWTFTCTSLRSNRKYRTIQKLNRCGKVLAKAIKFYQILWTSSSKGKGNRFSKPDKHSSATMIGSPSGPSPILPDRSANTQAA